MRISVKRGLYLIGFLLITFTIVGYAAQLEEVALKILPGGQNFKDRFASYYEPINVDVKPQVPQYTLPLDLSTITNYKDISYKFSLGKEAEKILQKNGFAVIDYGKVDDIVQPYKDMKEIGIPIFVTSDTVLHLYHIQFDETLKSIEEKEFYPDLVKASRAMRDKFLEQYKGLKGDLKEAARRNVAFFTVGLKLLEPDFEVPECVAKEVKWELDKIDKHEGFPNNLKDVEENSVFHYKEDYSQYVPRGHYTRSEELKRYFKAMMWYGRMTFLLKGKEPHGPISPPAQALISPKDAKIQMLQASLIASFVDKVMADEQRTIAEVWDRIYLVTAYYVGLSDDLSIYEYRDKLRKVFGSKFNITDLENEKELFDLKVEFAKLPSPKIYGGTGQSGIEVKPGQPFTPEHLDEILDDTKGMRFMGQRFVPDSYMMSQLVSPAAGDYMEKKDQLPFTAIVVPGRVVRGFPRGLDVMNLLGSKRAKELLVESKDTKYTFYNQQFAKLEEEFSKFDQKDWNKNLYWSWLYSLKALIGGFEDGYQTFMQTDAWLDKELNAALGSWSSLRHDTILYVKQSYTPTMPTSVRPRPIEKPVVGYVEPVAEFYARLVAMARMTNKGLKDMNVLDEASQVRLKSLEDILVRLLDIAKKELKNEELTETDYAFICNFGEQLESTVAGVDSKGMKTTIIADVHTDQNTKKCLEEGTGYVDLVLAAYKVPDGRVIIGAGPVLSYYEFKHPMKDRLTDEKWQQMLENGEAPAKPDWVKTFTAE